MSKKSKYFKVLIPLIILFSSLTICLPVYSHPHIFIDYTIEVISQANVMQGFRYNWKIDQMNSELLIDEFDRNRNRQVEKNEAAELIDNLLSNAAEFNFFTDMKVNQKVYPIRHFEQVNVKIENQRVVYSIFVPAKVRLDKTPKLISITPLDNTNFVAFLPQSPVLRLKGRGVSYKTLKVPTAPYDPLTFTLSSSAHG